MFRKSWPGGGDKRLLLAGILLFVPGTFKCLEKPWALRKSAINNIMAVTVGGKISNANGTINSLEEFVQEASSVYADAADQQQAAGAGAVVAVDEPDGRVAELVHNPYHLLLDSFPYPYSVRLGTLKHICRKSAMEAHLVVRSGLSRTFDRLYTSNNGYAGALARAVLVTPMFVAIWLFTTVSRRVAYDGTDITIMYVVLCCSAGLEVVSAVAMAAFRRLMTEPPWPDQVAQCSLIGYLIHHEEHRWFRRLASLLGCEVYADWLWCTAPSRTPASAAAITGLIHTHISQQWTPPPPPPSPAADTTATTIAGAGGDMLSKKYVQDVDTYRRFSDSRGEWTLHNEGALRKGDELQQERALRREVELRKKEGFFTNTGLVSSLRRPFDESVIVWHLATDLCFFHHADNGSEDNRRCREISNYMAYLLFVNPEMLVPGARRRVFNVAYQQVRQTLVEDEPPEDEDDLTKKKVPVGGMEDMARRIIFKMEESADGTGPGLVRDAWELARELIDLGGDTDEGKEKMWRVIRGAWVEMLCFSAGRCRGFLHAKNLGTGGEYLTYVWLLRAYMGMETLAQRIQITEEGDLGSTETQAVGTREHIV